LTNLKPHKAELISTNDIFLLVAKQIKLILAIPFFLTVLAFINVQFFTEKIYISSAKIISSGNQNSQSQAVGIAAQLGINIGPSERSDDSFYPEVIKSRKLANLMIKQRFSSIKYGENVFLADILVDISSSESKLKNKNHRFIAIQKFIDMVTVSKDLNSGIFTISVSGPEKKLVRDIAKALIDQLNILQKNYNRSKMSETKQFIEDRIKSTKVELEMAEEKLKNFSDRNRRIENSPALQLQKQRLNREVIVLTGVFTTLKQQHETTKIEEVRDADILRIIDEPNIPLTHSKPNKVMTILLAFIFGILLSLIIAVAREKKTDLDEQKKYKEAKKTIIKNIKSLIFYKRNFF
tara:strand:+ start:343 stop:1395 length:1053 start_codon:yes stop_codon:yes gene_type:complete